MIWESTHKVTNFWSLHLNHSETVFKSIFIFMTLIDYFLCPQIDSQSKLKKLLGCCSVGADFSCVLVHYPYTDPFSDSQEIDLSILTDAERELIEHCEVNWGYSQMPVIKLPEKWIYWRKNHWEKKITLNLWVLVPYPAILGFGVRRHLVFDVWAKF